MNILGRVATDQEMVKVREKSGFILSQGRYFEEKLGKSELAEHGYFNTIEGWIKHIVSLFFTCYFLLM